jgi:hypothetical protein
MPDAEPMVATLGTLLLQVPPATVLVKRVEVPIQVLVLPVIGASGFTVITAVDKQPVGST